MEKTRLIITAALLFTCLLTSQVMGNSNGEKRKDKTVVVAIHCQYQPISYLDVTTGKPDGFFIDIMEILAQRADLQISYVCRNGWDDIMNAIITGDADIGALMKSAAREKKLLFTSPFETSYLSFFTRSQSDIDPAALPSSGYTVGVIKGSMSQERLAGTQGMKLAIYGSYREGIFGLLAGEIGLFAGEESMVMKQMHETGLEDRIKKAGKPFLERQRALAVRRDNAHLAGLMNSTLDNFVGGPQYQQIYLKWFGAPAPYWTIRRTLTLSGILLLVIAGGMGFWRYASISRINSRLVRSIAERQRAEEIISHSLREKEVMLKEIYHRVKNNMQVICSLLSIQEEGISDQKVKTIFNETRTRVYSMALVHEKLYQSEDLSHIDFREYLMVLVHEISDTFGCSGVEISVDSDIIPLDVNSGIPCGLIVNELVTNSLKHAFPDGKTGTVRVGITRDSQGSCVLTVEDNGIGFPASLDFNKSSSLGLQLVNMLTRQLGGAITIERSDGTRVSIAFPEKQSGKIVQAS